MVKYGEAMLPKDATHDWALLEPEALPPDFPPVILIDVVGLKGFERLEVVVA